MASQMASVVTMIQIIAVDSFSFKTFPIQIKYFLPFYSHEFNETLKRVLLSTKFFELVGQRRGLIGGI